MNTTSVSLPLAHPLRRLVNFTIDSFVWLLLAFMAIVLLDHLFPRLDHFSINALAYISMLGLYLGYYFLMESLFQKTLGKFITGTKVVNWAGRKPGRGEIFQRCLCRLIPLELFWYLFSRNGLHDKWSGTRVVRQGDI